MPKTGRFYNLEKSWWNEDRHDPFRSTHAAIGYFKYLFDRFDNDIYLALAAYNAGPTYLDKQINKNKERTLVQTFGLLILMIKLLITFLNILLLERLFLIQKIWSRTS